jgi:hypothetical protein
MVMKTDSVLYRHIKGLTAMAVLLSAALLPLGAAAQNTVQGSITVNGKKTEFLHAYAFTRPTGVKDMVKTTLILTDKPLPAAAVTDKLERMTAQERSGIKLLEVGFNDGKDIVSFNPEVDALKGSRINSAHKATLDTFSDQALKGRLFTESELQIRNAPGTYSFDVQFNVAMTAPRVSDAAGAKGWETPQGKALAEYLRAARAGDKAALRRVITAETVKELEGPQSASILKSLKSEPDPKTAQLESLVVDGNVAKIKVVQRFKDGAETSNYEVRRVGNAWLVAP